MTRRTRSARQRVVVAVAINPDHWHHLQGEARLLSEVSGETFTPEGIIQAVLERTLADRKAAFCS